MPTRPEEKMRIAHFLVPDSGGRVFYPQQGGHTMIANLIMYQMGARNADSLNYLYRHKI